MNDPWLHILSHAHSMLVEQVMAVHGRGSSDPKTYRRILERMDFPALRRSLAESDFSVLEMEVPMNTAGESPAQFPVPSLTETAGVIASTDTGHAPGSARESLTLQSVLP